MRKKVPTIISIVTIMFFIVLWYIVRYPVYINIAIAILVVECLVTFTKLYTETTDPEIVEDINQAFEDSEREKVIYIGKDKYLSSIYKGIIEHNGYFDAELIDGNTIKVFIVEKIKKEKVREELSEYSFDEFIKNFKFSDDD